MTSFTKTPTDTKICEAPSTQQIECILTTKPCGSTQHISHHSAFSEASSVSTCGHYIAYDRNSPHITPGCGAILLHQKTPTSDVASEAERNAFVDADFQWRHILDLECKPWIARLFYMRFNKDVPCDCKLLFFNKKAF